MRRNFTIAGWNGLFTMFNPEFIKSYSSMVVDYDWYCVILLATRVFSRHFWGPWSLLILEYNLKLIWIRDWRLFGKKMAQWFTSDC